LQHYAVDEEDERIAAFRHRLTRPERSVRNSPWLRRIAVTTAAGKNWQRVHVVDHPLTEYLRYELVGYVESAACGEEIRITDRAASSEFASLGPDFWLFDADTADAFALLMRYDTAGHFLSYDHTTDPHDITNCVQQRTIVLSHSLSLNTYLASTQDKTKVA
jgi:hypothetical protein